MWKYLIVHHIIGQLNLVWLFDVGLETDFDTAQLTTDSKNYSLHKWSKWLENNNLTAFSKVKFKSLVHTLVVARGKNIMSQ